MVNNTKAQVRLTLYVLLYIIYILSESFFKSGALVSLTRWVFLLVSFIFYLKVMLCRTKKPPFIMALGILYLMFFIYGAIVVAEGHDFYTWRSDGRRILSFVYLMQISRSLLPVFTFYYFAKKGVFDDRYLNRMMLLFFFAVCVEYIITMQARMSVKGTDEVTNNAGYVVVSMLPMMMFLKAKSLKQYIGIGIILLMTFGSMKRGSILIGGICLGIYFLYLLRNSKRSAIIGIFVTMFIALGIVYYIYQSMMESSDYFQNRVEDTLEGDSSGRDNIYAFFFEYYLEETTTQQQFIGLGANATLDIFGQYAHNDWLEIAINQGLLGLFIFLIFWLVFLGACLRKQPDPRIRATLWMLFAMFFLKSFFSMSYRSFTLYSNIVLGYCIAVSFLYSSQRPQEKNLEICQ